MGRQQKYQARKRYLYALLFRDSGRAYIGQTVDLNRRRREHSKTWREPFDFVRLSSMTGTQAQAEDYEFAWRWAARQAGWIVVAKTWDGPPFVVDVRHRMNGDRWHLTGQCRWPRQWRRRSRWGWFWQWLAWEGAAMCAMWMFLSLPVSL